MDFDEMITRFDLTKIRPGKELIKRFDNAAASLNSRNNSTPGMASNTLEKTACAILRSGSALPANLDLVQIGFSNCSIVDRLIRRGHALVNRGKLSRDSDCRDILCDGEKECPICDSLAGKSVEITERDKYAAIRQARLVERARRSAPTLAIRGIEINRNGKPVKYNVVGIRIE